MRTRPEGEAASKKAASKKKDAPKAKRAAKLKKPAKAPTKNGASERTNKKAEVLAMMKRAKGVTWRRSSRRADR
jgi:hypothetical protein